MPFCDNRHRVYNKKNNCSYKSVKITPLDDIEIDIVSSNWDKDEK